MIREEDILIIEDPVLTAADRLYLPQVAQGLRTTLRHLFKKKSTLQYPEDRRERYGIDERGPRLENYRGVHRLNRDEQGRVACFLCETVCPAHCIHIDGAESPWPDREKYPTKFDIDELRCIYCGMCEEACPVDAIELTPEYKLVGQSREAMIFDKEKLLNVYDQTVTVKPRKNPKITGYSGTGDRAACREMRDDPK